MSHATKKTMISLSIFDSLNNFKSLTCITLPSLTTILHCKRDNCKQLEASVVGKNCCKFRKGRKRCIKMHFLLFHKQARTKQNLQKNAKFEYSLIKSFKPSNILDYVFDSTVLHPLRWTWHIFPKATILRIGFHTTFFLQNFYFSLYSAEYFNRLFIH